MVIEIYTSLKEFHKYEITMIEVLKDYSFNLFKYKSNFKGKIEEGFKIDFTQKLTKKELNNIYKDLKIMFNIGCFYLIKGTFKGCIKDYLNNKKSLKC